MLNTGHLKILFLEERVPSENERVRCGSFGRCPASPRLKEKTRTRKIETCSEAAYVGSTNIPRRDILDCKRPEKTGVSRHVRALVGKRLEQGEGARDNVDEHHETVHGRERQGSGGGRGVHDALDGAEDSGSAEADQDGFDMKLLYFLIHICRVKTAPLAFFIK